MIITSSLAIRNYFLRYKLFDYIAILVIGLGLLLFFYFQSFPKITWLDEVDYAVMGRNIATGRGLITNVYHARSILEKGYPSQGVHMSGHGVILGVAFWLLGPETEYAVFFPNHISYLVTGILLFWLGKNLFNRWTGFGAALAFYTFPSVVGYINVVMPDLTLTLVSLIFVIVWYKSLTAPKLIHSILLAVVLVAGLLIRESFLILLPLVLYALWRWPQPIRSKAMLYFGSIFTLLFFVLFLPLYLGLAPYPHYMSFLLDSSDPIAFMLERLKENLDTFLGLLTIEEPGWQLPLLLQMLLSLIVAAFFFAFNDIQRKVCIYGLYTLICTILAGIVIYPINFRILMYSLPPIIVLLVGLISKIKLTWLKYNVVLSLVCFLLYSSSLTNDYLAGWRRQVFAAEKIRSEMIAKLSDHFHPRTVFTDFDFTFIYAWTHYPVTTIYILKHDAIELNATQRLMQQMPIDMIVVRNVDHRNRIEVASQESLLPANYVLIGEDKGIYVFVNSALIHQ